MVISYSRPHSPSLLTDAWLKTTNYDVVQPTKIISGKWPSSIASIYDKSHLKDL